MNKQSYKDYIKFLAHKHKDALDQTSTPAFYYNNPQWPEFIIKASEFYQHPVQKVVEDLFCYRNSSAFHKDKVMMEAMIAAAEKDSL